MPKKIFISTERRAFTMTVRTLESNRTHAAVSFAGITGLTGCFALAGVTNARVLLKQKRKQK